MYPDRADLSKQKGGRFVTRGRRTTVSTSVELSTRQRMVQLLEQIEVLDLELHVSFRLVRQNYFDARNRHVLYAAMTARDELGRQLRTCMNIELGKVHA
jgi:hypothetical protein